MMIVLTVQAEDKCKIIYDMAHIIMENRQNGIPAIDMIKNSQDNKFVRILVVAAFKKSRYTTPRIRKMVIEDFASKMYISCLDK